MNFLPLVQTVEREKNKLGFTPPLKVPIELDVPLQWMPVCQHYLQKLFSPNAIDMAQPAQPGLMPAEIAFLCEMELVTVVPRERLSSLRLLGVCQRLE